MYITMPNQPQTNGMMNTPTGTAKRAAGFSRTRFQLRNAWNGTSAAMYSNGGARPAQSPFRAVNNAGNIAPSNCNPKYVYDSSVFLRFKKQRAIGRNYNNNK